jgi:chromosomal replication initiator protein
MTTSPRHEIWQPIKTALKAELPTNVYRMWIKSVHCNRFEDGRLVLECPNAFFKNRISRGYGKAITAQARKILGGDCKIKFVVTSQTPSAGKSAGIAQRPLPHRRTQAATCLKLRQDFTFDQFVVGDCNALAYTSALSMASHDCGQSTFLYLTSSPGLGKTHLTQAVGNQIALKRPAERVYYISAEDFVQEMLAAIWCDDRNAFNAFSKRYRKECDILLLEDIHHLMGKSRSQVEFSRIFDTLLDMGKKIVLSSCFLPGDIPKLTDQLQSRLSSGMITRLETPDHQTRLKILYKIANAPQYAVPEDIIHFLASELTDDVRQLKGGFFQVVEKASLMGEPISMPLAESVVGNMVRARKAITMNTIQNQVCKAFGIKHKEIISRSRKKQVALARQVAMYLARNYTELTLQNIARSFNRRHGTVLYAVGQIDQAMRRKGRLHRQVTLLQERLETGRPG